MEEANQGEKNMVPDKISNFLILLAFHMNTYLYKFENEFLKDFTGWEDPTTEKVLGLVHNRKYCYCLSLVYGWVIFSALLLSLGKIMQPRMKLSQ